jgi:hypothetical protein
MFSFAIHEILLRLGKVFVSTVFDTRVRSLSLLDTDLSPFISLGCSKGCWNPVFLENDRRQERF